MFVVKSLLDFWFHRCTNMTWIWKKEGSLFGGEPVKIMKREHEMGVMMLIFGLYW
jgi:hypothetical protein